MSQSLPYWCGNLGYFFTDLNIAHKFELVWLMQKGGVWGVSEKFVCTQEGLFT